MVRFLLGLLAGLLFGVGLVISGMANPEKVLNFFDLFGTWDPSLMFVMVGGILVTFTGYRLLGRRSGPWFDTQFNWPTLKTLDTRLIVGSAIFGVGWGLAGVCPGPAFTLVHLLSLPGLLLLVAMLAGMIVAKYLAPILFKS